MTGDIIAFVRSNLDTDEQLALRAKRMRWDHPADAPWESARLSAERIPASVTFPMIGTFAQPDRVLRQVRAGRELVDQYEQALRDLQAEEARGVQGSAMTAVTTLGYAVRRLAAVYEDRDGYERDWGMA